MKAAYLADAQKISSLKNAEKAEKVAEDHAKAVQMAEFEKQLALAVKKSAQKAREDAQIQFDKEKKDYMEKVAYRESQIAAKEQERIAEDKKEFAEDQRTEDEESAEISQARATVAK